MAWIYLLFLAIVLCFGVVLLFGAPYVPTLTKQLGIGLDMLDLKRGQTMLELGCGDGKVLVAAAQRGLNCVGYELNPLLAALCWLRTRRYGKQVKIVWGDYWRKDWPRADGIYAFIMQRHMAKLDTKITQQNHTSIRLVSFAFEVEGRKPAREDQGMYLYIYK